MHSTSIHSFQINRIYRVLNTAAAIFMVAAFLLLLTAKSTLNETNECENVVLFGKKVPHTCLYQLFFHKKCIGCGLTRAIVSLLDGHVEEANRLHPSALWVVIWLVVQIILRIILIWFPISGKWLYWDLGITVVSMVMVIYLPVIFF